MCWNINDFKTDSELNYDSLGCHLENNVENLIPIILLI